MVLPSQTGRASHRGAYMYRRKRFSRKLIGLGAGLAVTAGAWFAWSAGSPDSAKADADGGSRERATLPADHEQAPARLRGDSAGKEATSGGTASSAPATDPASTERAPERGTTLNGESATASTRHKGDLPDARPPATTPVRSPASETKPAPPQPPTGAEATRALNHLRYGLQIWKSDPIEGRRYLSDALRHDALPPAEAQQARDVLTQINAHLLFGRDVHPEDPYSRRYTVQSGDSLSKIVRKMSLLVDWRFVRRINELKSDVLQLNSPLKLVTGPFHAVVHKHAFRLDLWMGDGDDSVFVASFPVGLGEFNSTPVGMFRVRANSKLINPEWVNPRTRERFLPDDPSNPIGEHWIGLVGIDDATQQFEGYGIHGTIEPDSIGRQQSMGCIRMLPEDVAIIYETLMEGVSTVEIRP